jgi:hypothetical protein
LVAAFLQKFGGEDKSHGDAERSAIPRRMVSNRRNPAELIVPGDAPMANQ